MNIKTKEVEITKNGISKFKYKKSTNIAMLATWYTHLFNADNKENRRSARRELSNNNKIYLMLEVSGTCVLNIIKNVCRFIVNSPDQKKKDEVCVLRLN